MARSEQPSGPHPGHLSGQRSSQQPGQQGLIADWIEFSAVDGPGNRFVLFLQGCGFDCPACHNPQTIPARSPDARRLSVEQVLDIIGPAAPFLSGVTVSGGEATRQPHFLRALFDALAADPALCRLTRFVDTNGDAPRATWELLDPVLDGAMVDLKSLDPGLHRRLTGRPNDRVLASIELLARRGRLHEVRLLMLPGVNDSAPLLDATGAWLADVDPRMRLKVIGFRPHGVRPSPVSPEGVALLPGAPAQPHEMQSYAARLRQHGDFDIVVV